MPDGGGRALVSDEQCEVELEVGGCDEGQSGELTPAGTPVRPWDKMPILSLRIRRTTRLKSYATRERTRQTECARAMDPGKVLPSVMTPRKAVE